MPGTRAATHQPTFLSRRDRPRLLYVIPQHDFSGAEIMHVPVLQADLDPLLACPPNSRTEQLAIASGVPVAALPFRSMRHSAGALETLRSMFRGLAGARDLRRILRAERDRTVVYCTSLRAAMLASLAVVGLRRRVLWHVPDWMPPAPLRQMVRALALWRCDAAIAHSHAVARDFVGRRARLRGRTVVVHPAVTLDDGEPAAAPGRPRAAIVGSVTRTKRVALAIEIARRVLAEEPEFELLVIGRAQFRASDFAFEKDLHASVAADDALRERVRFVGWTDDVRGVLRDSGLLLHCRPDEPFGIVLLEAMSVGLPVVAPAAAGPAEIVEDGASGLLYRPDDAADAAAKVLAILRTPARAAALGRVARERVAARFSTDRQLAETERVLERLAT